MPVDTFTIDRERRDIDVSREIALLQPSASPFTVILLRARKLTTRTAEFDWWEDQIDAYWTQINNATGYTAGDVNLVVDDATIFKPKDVVKNSRTGEVMFVTAVNTTTNTITVTRGYGTTPATAMNDNDWLVRLGNAMEENSKAPESKLTQPTKKVNYTQIIRTPFDQSMTSEAEDLRTAESERVRLRKKKLIEHRMDIERAILFGEPKEDPTGKRRMTGGLLYFITTNVKDVGGAMTEAEFEDFCEMLFAYGSSDKLLIAAPHVLSVINQIARNKIETTSGEETYGIRLKKYLSYHGDLYLVPSKALEKDYGSMAIGVDMRNIYYRPLKGRDTKLRTNIQDNDVDGWKDEYLTEMGLKVELEKTHAVLKNCTSFSAA
ncbi:MAG TPA: DUF5309 domain-containing protein [Syntrophomonadaceae bacterium]|nr:DUF5309 domain-containing protein [Syntrophomonadaceae bacterium]